MKTATAMPIRLPRTPGGSRVTQMNVALSEWTKFRSLRSTLYALAERTGSVGKRSKVGQPMAPASASTCTAP